MNQAILREDWPVFLQDFNAKYSGRRTRLGIFEEDDANNLANDYWIEDGLPLIGVDLFSRGEHADVGLVLDGYTHSMTNVSSLSVVVQNGSDDGLDIVDAEGRTTILRFEDAPSADDRAGH